MTLDVHEIKVAVVRLKGGVNTKGSTGDQNRSYSVSHAHPLTPVYLFMCL